MKYLILILAFLFSTVTYPAEGNASWYGPGFHGKRTASGEIFNQNALTVAHNSLPFGTIIRVSYKGKSVNVKVNDTGGFAKYGRVMDLSKGAAKALGCKSVCHVNYSVVYKPIKKRRYIHNNLPKLM